MKIKFFLLFSLSFLISSCEKRAYWQPYEMTVKLVDANGKPIKGRKLNLITGLNHGHLNFSNGVKDSLLTDNTGSAVFKYDLNSGDAFSITPFDAVITVKEDSTFVGANLLQHSIGGSQPQATKRIKLTGTIIMDSLVPFKIHVKVYKPNIVFLMNLSPKGLTETQYEANKNGRYKDTKFIELSSTISSNLLDTIVTGMVYSKIPMGLFVGQSNGTLFTSLTYNIDATVDRKKIFLVTY